MRGGGGIERVDGRQPSGLTTPRSVLVVEDDPAMRERFSAAIRSCPELAVAAAVGSRAEAFLQLDRGEPDILLIDLGLPDGNGVEVIRDARNRGYATEIMVITVFGDEKHVVSAIEAGATGYLLKDGETESIARSVLALLEGGSPISPAIARHLLKRFREPTPEPSPGGLGVPRLTEREQEILLHLVKGFTFAETADRLAISAHAVTSHVKHIYRKLEVRSRTEAVYEVLQLGHVKRDGR